LVENCASSAQTAVAAFLLALPLAAALDLLRVACIPVGKLALHLVQLDGLALLRHGVEPLDALAQLGGSSRQALGLRSV
jgi:hypothetical protein